MEMLRKGWTTCTQTVLGQSFKTVGTAHINRYGRVVDFRPARTAGSRTLRRHIQYVQRGFGWTATEPPRQRKDTFEILAPLGQSEFVQSLWLPNQGEELVLAVKDLPKLYTQTNLRLIKSIFEGQEVRFLSGFVVEVYNPEKRAAIEVAEAAAKAAAEVVKREAELLLREEELRRDEEMAEKLGKLAAAALEPLKGKALEVPVLSQRKMTTFRFGGGITAKSLAFDSLYKRAEATMPLGDGEVWSENMDTWRFRNEDIDAFAKVELERLTASGELAGFEAVILAAFDERNQERRRQWEKGKGSAK